MKHSHCIALDPILCDACEVRSVRREERANTLSGRGSLAHPSGIVATHRAYRTVNRAIPGFIREATDRPMIRAIYREARRAEVAAHRATLASILSGICAARGL